MNEFKASKEAIQLLKDLNIHNCTQRHLITIDEFIKSKNDDLPNLLKSIGEWDDIDLEIAKYWFEKLQTKSAIHPAIGE